MSTLSRYLLRQYSKVLLLSVLTFISILVVSRLETVAQFATLGAPLSKICLFLLFQIPYVLPIAIPLSSLLSAMLLFMSLSQAHELTALRAAGFSMTKIFAPLLFAATLLFFATFYISSEMATTAHLRTRRMVHDFSAVNPLILLQNARIAKLQGAYVSMEPVKVGEEVRDVIVAGKLKKRLFLYLIQDLKLKKGNLEGEQISFISSPQNHLAIENQRSMHAPASDFAFLLRPKGWKIANDHLNFSLLRARKKSLENSLDGKAKKNIIKNRSEVVRRFSVSFAAFTFTLLGASLGVQISRLRSRRSILLAALLSAFALLSFFIAHELDHLFYVSLALLIVPHILILASVFRALYRVQRGQA
ncbi:MAG: LptF/LptG family permease [Chlamydiales bacterium]|nr:LptF/LptG family permease [Chlamydiales bacterium]